MVLSGQVTSTTMLKEDNGSWFPATQVPGLFSQKDWLTALLLSFFWGPWVGTVSTWVTRVWAW
jgi:hypothetical protein